MDRLKNALLGVYAALSPLKEVLIVTIALVIVNLITELLSLRKQSKRFTLNRAKEVVVKLIIYVICVIMGHYVGLYLTGPELPMLKIVTSMIGIAEVQSVLENLSTISGNSMFTAISRAISPQRRGRTNEPGGSGESK